MILQFSHFSGKGPKRLFQHRPVVQFQFQTGNHTGPSRWMNGSSLTASLAVVTRQVAPASSRRRQSSSIAASPYTGVIRKGPRGNQVDPFAGQRLKEPGRVCNAGKGQDPLPAQGRKGLTRSAAERDNPDQPVSGAEYRDSGRQTVRKCAIRRYSESAR